MKTTPSDDSAPENRWATTADLERLEDRLAAQIEKASSKGPQYLTMFLAALAVVASLSDKIHIG